MTIADHIIFDHQALQQKLSTLQKEGKKIVFTNGCFDILHRGHMDYMEKSREKGDILVVALNTDASVKRLGKGEARPFNNLDERAFHMAALRSVDFVTAFDEDTPMEVVEILLPDVVIKGGDYDVNTFVGSEFIRNRGGEAYIIPFVEGYSTTKWLKMVQSKLNESL
jgi:rfaE bifunctional protein nucleotidyltransferase chain/domain